jgi:class 3 adenylate cyclase
MMALVRSDLPSGTVTFLFTDVEGSTKLLHELGAEHYAQALAEHRRLLREAFAAHESGSQKLSGGASSGQKALSRSTFSSDSTLRMNSSRR